MLKMLKRTLKRTLIFNLIFARKLGVRVISSKIISSNYFLLYLRIIFVHIFENFTYFLGTIFTSNQIQLLNLCVKLSPRKIFFQLYTYIHTYVHKNKSRRLLPKKPPRSFAKKAAAIFLATISSLFLQSAPLSPV